jgi:hypothetical protein
MRGLRRWNAWRTKNPLEKRIEAPGVLAELDSASGQKLVRTERLLRLLLSVKPVPLVKKRRKSKKLPARRLGWLEAKGKKAIATLSDSEATRVQSSALAR